MEIIKLATVNNGNLWAVFDEIPELTYEKIGQDYVGSAIDDKGNIIFSEFLKRERFGNAFAGRELSLKMKDGTIQKIKNYWYTCGAYKKHGEFIGIGARTLEGLQDCFVFTSYSINKQTYLQMIDEYLQHDKVYEYKDLREWSRLQYDWYPVIVHGKEIPFMMNYKGDMVERESKQRVYCRCNVWKVKLNKLYHFFKFEYKDINGRLTKLDANYLEVLKATLPFTEEEIIKNCKLDGYYDRLKTNVQ